MIDLGDIDPGSVHTPLRGYSLLYISADPRADAQLITKNQSLVVSAKASCSRGSFLLFCGHQRQNREGCEAMGNHVYGHGCQFPSRRQRRHPSVRVENADKHQTTRLDHVHDQPTPACGFRRERECQGRRLDVPPEIQR